MCVPVLLWAQVKIVQPTCEQSSSPIGIATNAPHFSWQLSSEKRNVQQTGYQILVATSKDNLNKNVGDVWNSGKVESDQSLHVTFKGSALQPDKYYYWKVKTFTNDGESEWSNPAFFTVAYLNKNDWKATWIGYDKAFPWDSLTTWSRLSARYFRKEFFTTKKIKKVFAHIVGLGMYELYINGKKIDDRVLAPAPTDYRKTVFSNTFDVTEKVKDGQNAIGVVLGNGRFFTMRQNYKPKKINNFGFPKLLLQFDIVYADGTSQLVVSDQSWKFTADGPIRMNNEYDGEEYDATKELGDWSDVNYKDANWLKPMLVKAPEGKVVPQPNPAMKVMKTIQPVSIKQLNDSVHILDMGQNFSGWLQLKAKGNRGQRIKLRFAESLQNDGSLYVANLRDAKVTDVYTLKGGDEETWHPRFVYHGFRFVEITNYPGTPTVADFEGQLIFDQMQTTGTLTTSNETINQIVKNAWWGIASDYKGMPVDCPQRNERQPWLGDRAQGAYGESFLFGNSSLYAKWLDDIEQAQTPEGAIPDVAPAFWNYYSDNVTWPGTYILVADMLHHQYGDQQSIVKHYASMKKWMGYMKSRYMKDFIVTKDKYGDWCVPPEDLKMIRSQDSTRTTKGELLATAYYYKLLQIMKNFATISGNNADVASYDQLANNVKKAFNDKFFKADLNQYDNGTITANLLPLYFNIVPETKRQQVFDNIIKKLNADNMHISTGVIGTQWLMRGLTENNRSDAAFKLASNTTYPSWGYMIANGATTIWELWNGNTANPKMNSQNHIMLLGDLLIWMFEDLGGIKAAKPAFKEIEMKPAFNAGLNSSKASYNSSYGAIKSEWEQTNGKIKWHIEVPANTNAIVHIPAKSVKDITESGKTITSDIQLIRFEKGDAVLKIGSGIYSFEN